MCEKLFSVCCNLIGTSTISITVDMTVHVQAGEETELSGQHQLLSITVDMTVIVLVDTDCRMI